MYQKPQLQPFGTFRQLTQVGFNAASDGLLTLGQGTGDTGDDQPSTS
jgi:hypothetical protein